MSCSCLSHNGFLTSAGYAEVAQRSDGVYDTVDMFRDLCYLDRVGSVSALVEVEERFDWNDQLLDNQYQRFLHHGT